MVDLTRDSDGVLHARVLDVVPGRTGTAYASWLRAQPAQFTAGITEASLDPFRDYANAIRDEPPDAVAVLDAFHVVKLGTEVVDEVRRRVGALRVHPPRFDDGRARAFIAAHFSDEQVRM